jgi:hypothetical protein
MKILLDENLPVKLKYCLQNVCEEYAVKIKVGMLWRIGTELLLLQLIIHYGKAYE